MSFWKCWCFETKNVSTRGGLEPLSCGFMLNVLTTWAIEARHFLYHVLERCMRNVFSCHNIIVFWLDMGGNWMVVTVCSYSSVLVTCACNALHWRHNEHDCVSNHQPHDCLLNRLFRRRSKKTSKPRVTGLSLTLSQWSSSDNPVAIKCGWNLDPVYTEMPLEKELLVASVFPVVFQWLSSGLPVCSNYAN